MVHGAILDRPDRLARGAVEDVGEAGLRDLGNGFDQLAVDHDVEQVRGRGDVVVPDPVADGLEVPDALARLRVDADQALGEQVVARPVGPVVVVRRRARRQVDVPQFVVRAHRRPHVRVAGRPPGLVLPGLDAKLVVPWDRVETPLELTRVDVVGAHVARRRVAPDRVVEDLRADDHAVAHDDRRRAVGDVADRVVAGAEILRQVDHAVLAEGPVRLAGRGVDRDELPTDRRDKEALLLTVRPVLDAAGADRPHRRAAALPGPRVVDPLLLAGRRIEQRHLAEAGRREQASADHQRHGAEQPGVVARQHVQRHFVVRRPPTPSDLEPAEVRAVDLGQRRIAT